MLDDEPENNQLDINEHLLRYEEMVARNKQYFFDLDVLLKIIEHYDENDLIEKSLKAVNYGISLFPYSVELLLKKAQIFADMEKYEMALSLINKMLLLSPNDANAIILKSDILILQNKYQESIDVLNQGIEQHPDQTEFYLLEIADAYFEWNDLENAFNYLKKALEFNHKNEFALNRIWYLVEVVEKYEESLQLHLNIIDKDPYNYVAWSNLSQAYCGLGLLEKAFEACEYAIAIDDCRDTAYRDAGEICIALKKYNDAIFYFTKACDVAGADAALYFSMAYSYEKLKDYASARIYYKRSIQINKNFGESYFRIAETLAKQKEWKRAIPYYKSACKLNENYVAYYGKYANAALQAGLQHPEYLKDALKCYEELTKTHPLKKTYWKNYIKTQILLSFNLDAMYSINQALSYLGHDQADLLYIAAVIYYKNKYHKDALQYLQTAYTLQPSKLKLLLEYGNDEELVDLLQKLIIE